MASLYLPVAANHLIQTARHTLHEWDYGRLLLTLVEWAEGTVSKNHAEYQLIMHIERVDVELAKEFRVYLDYADRMQAARMCRKRSADRAVVSPTNIECNLYKRARRTTWPVSFSQHHVT